MRVFIGCSSYDGLNEIYYDSAKELSEFLVNKNSSLVFGGCAHGIMGVVYDVFKNNKKEIYAIQTEHYKNELDNLSNEDCIKEVKSSTLEQLERFMELSDVMVILPGGYGTYNELFYMISEYVNETHNCKIIIANINHYFDELNIILDKIFLEKFATKRNFVKIIDTLDEFESVMEEIC